MIGQEFQRHVTLQLSVARPIDHTHAALAEG
jgi:hypothetical protein